jgi:heat shock protein HslJ
MSTSGFLFARRTRWSALMALALGLAACAGAAPPGAPAVPATPAPPPSWVSLWGTEWRLESLGQGLVLPGASLAFSDPGRVSGNASCNRFFGPAQIERDRLRLGPLGASRMACAGPVMEQEQRYLAALQRAYRFEVQGRTLLIHTETQLQPLRLVR